jgi:hypothetical protein
MSRHRRALPLFLLLLGALLAPQEAADAEPARRWRAKAQTQHFVFGVRQVDWDRVVVDAEMLARMGEWLESGWETYIERGGMKEPETVTGRGVKTIVLVCDFTGTKKAGSAGFYRSDVKRLYLNAAAYRKTLPADRGGVTPMKATAPHELFHAIQWAYDGGEERWFVESTATWAGWLAQPDALKCIGVEREFVKNMHLGLRSFGEGVRGGDIDDATKHAYGASLFYRFLGQYGGGVGLLKRLWDEAGRTAGTDPLLTTSLVLGDSAALGPAFRERYDRFAVACLLRHNMPGSEQLPNAALFRGVRPRIHDASDEVGSMIRKAMKEGLAVKPTEFDLSVGGVAAAYAALLTADSKPPDMPEDLGLEVRVRAAPQEVSLQGVLHTGAWTISGGAYDAAKGEQRVVLGGVARASKPAVVVLVRYAAEPAAKEFRVKVRPVREETWVIDPEWVKEQERKMEEDRRKAEEDPEGILGGLIEGVGFGIAEALLQMFKDARVTLQADGRFRMAVQGTGVAGTWTRDESGQRVTLKVESGFGGATPDSPGKTVEFNAEGSRRVLREGDESIPFVLEK